LHRLDLELFALPSQEDFLRAHQYWKAEFMSIKAAATFVLLSVPFFLLTVWALVDISIKDFKTLKEKVIWYLIALIPFIGWLIYLILGFRRGVKPNRSPG
jgi:uncharacterized membrane protein YhaH (DUF805 family)